jgi:hypothetical protein
MVLHPLSQRMVVLRYDAAFSRLPPICRWMQEVCPLSLEALTQRFFSSGRFPKTCPRIVRNNSILEVQIARNLPVFGSRKAAAETRNLLGNVSGVSSRAANLIRKFLNPNLRQDLTLREEEKTTRLANMVMNTDCEEDLILDMSS